MATTQDNTGVRRILVIDDDPFTRTLVGKCLKGFEVTAEHDGLSGLRAAQKSVPDLIVSDFMMPKMDGLRLMKLLRMDARTRDIPVILLSAVAEEEYRQQALQIGARALVSKSAMRQDLLPAVERIVGKPPASA